MVHRSLPCLLVLTVGVISALAAQGRLQSSVEQTRQQSLEADWSAELPATESKVVKYKSPIKRVIGLLNKMKIELTKDSKSDTDMYDTMVCWCETNDKEKTQAIKKCEMTATDLESEIEARSAKFGEEATEIERLKKEIAENTAALKQAIAVREKGLGEFRGEETDLTQNIVNLKNAIAVLSKHNAAASFAQIDAPVFTSLQSVLRDLAFKRELILASKTERGPRVRPVLLSMNEARLNRNELDLATQSLLSALETKDSPASPLPIEFAQKILAQSAQDVHGSGFLQLKGHEPYSESYKSYNSRSGPIFGILTQMLEEFEADLSDAQKQDAQSAADAKALAAAKEEQIAAGKAKLDELEESHANNMKALGDAKETLQATRDTRSADVEFLQNLKVTCQGLDRQFEDRTKTRSMELAAVTETIKILTEDDAFELMRKTVTFLQESLESREYRARRLKAVAVLKKAAQEPEFKTDDLMAAWKGRQGVAKTSPLRGMRARMDLSTLSLTVALDSFTKVKAMMDKMVVDLKAQQAAEVQFKANCTATFDATEKELYDKKETKKSLENEISALAKEVQKLDGEMAEAKATIASSEAGIKKASEAREKENAAFQTSVADQRATQAVLKKALLRLKEYYKTEKGGASLAQQSKQEPPVKFQAYDNNKGASPVIGLIEQIIEDSEAVEADDFKAEQEAQAGYETLMKDTNDIIAELTAAIDSKTKLTAEHAESSETAKLDLGSTEGEIGSLEAFEANKHAECDWVMKNFAIRQKARLSEIEAVQAAKAILSGAR